MPAQKKSTIKGTTASKSTLLPLARKAISLRSQNVQIQDNQNKECILTRAKRRADISPLKNDKIKRSALGNLTNNVLNKNNNYDQKENFTAKEKIEVPLLSKSKTANSIITTTTTTGHNVHKASNVLKTISENSMVPPANGAILRPTKVLTRAAAKNAAAAAAAITLTSSTISNNSSSSTSSSSSMPSAVTKIQQHQQNLQALGLGGGAAISTAKIKDKHTTETTNLKPTTRRISNEFEKTEDSLYMSALEDMPSSDSLRLSGNFENLRRRSLQQQQSAQKPQLQKSASETSTMSVDENDSIADGDRLVVPSPIKYPSVPEDVNDFDKENWNDPFQVSEYAMDIFEYLKQREAEFPIVDYIDKQKHLSKWMRSLLVDWMVEVQETFELNHETLYLAVKLVDLYLGKEIVIKDKLQLLGAGALFISCKYDERTPPLIDDFLYICDGAYNHDELIKMEMNILKSVNFDLGIPLSYRFLRRYARCAKVPMQTLTLARYILEFSLMDYATICLRDSQMACAVLFMALRMTGLQNPWNKTLEYYSGYKLEDFAYIVPILNSGLHRKPRETIKTIRNKYSHRIFFEVAKIPLLSTEKLFETTGLMSNLINQTK